MARVPLHAGIRGARQELAEAPGLDDHGRAAELALLVGRAVRRPAFPERLHVVAGVLVLDAGQVGTEAPGLELDGRAALGAALLGQVLGLEAVRVGHERVQIHGLERLAERRVEVLEHALPQKLAILDPVELQLHTGGELDVEDLGELADHDLLDQLAELGREEPPLVDLHVFAGAQGRDDGAVGRRPADAEPLELLHQAGLGEPGRRLGEVLGRRDLPDLDRIALGERRDRREVVHRLPLLLLAPFHIEHMVPVEDEHRAGGPELVPPEVEVHDRHVVDRRRHLRGDEPLPDELVQPELVGLEEGLDLLGPAADVGGANGLVGVLHAGVLLRAVGVRRGRQVRLGVAGADEVPHRRDGRVRHAHRVGPHIGDEADRAVLAHIPALVQVLRRPHGAPRAEAELLGGLLLQRAGGERCARVLPPVPLLDLGDDERQLPHGVHHGLRVLGRVELRLVAVHLGERGLERLAVLGQQGLDAPVLLGREGADLALALDDEPEGDGLHPAGGEAGLDAAPEDRAGLVADEPVEDAAGLLRVHLAVVDHAGMLHGLVDGVLGDLVEQHPMRRGARAELVGYVPGDGLALAVRVGGEIYGRGRLGRLLEVGQRLGLALDGDVLGLEVTVDVYAELAGRQIPEVPDGGLHVIAGAEILADRLGLGGRLDDHERDPLGAGPAARLGHPGAGLGRLGAGLGRRRGLGALAGLGWGFYRSLGSGRHVCTMPDGVIAGSTSVAARNPRGGGFARRGILRWLRSKAYMDEPGAPSARLALPSRPSDRPTSCPTTPHASSPAGSPHPPPPARPSRPPRLHNQRACRTVPGPPGGSAPAPPDRRRSAGAGPRSCWLRRAAVATEHFR